MLNDIAFLPVVTKITDDLGQTEEVEEYNRQVFCRKESVNRSEFFQAGQNGLKPSCVLIVYTLDYKEEKTIKHNNKVYSIYRTFERKDETIELYCEVKAGVY